MLRSGQLNYGYVPSGASQSRGWPPRATQHALAGLGHHLFLMNFHNPTTGPLIQQLYVRQAMQA